MRIPSSALRVAAAAALAAACSHAAPSTSSAPEPAPPRAQAAPGQVDLTGDWAVQLIQQDGTPGGGMLRLVPSSGGYGGNLQLEGQSRPFFVRSAQAQGNHIIVIFDTPDGDARIEGNLRAPTQFDGLYTSRTLNGRVTMSRR